MKSRATALLVTAGLLLTAVPSSASDPASHDVAVPASPGETVEVEWTGIIAPGASPSSDCSGSPTADGHLVELSVPPGVYDGLGARMTARIEATGPFAPSTDVIVTLVKPDGTTQSGDGGFVGTAEETGISDPVAGTYEILACAFAGATPQDYAGTLTITTEEKGPLQMSRPGCTPPAQSPKFEMAYIDEARAGGEPLVVRHPEGQLLWGSHAGTTHFYSPEAASPSSAAFIENYDGRTYYYVSEDGATFDFVPRQGPGDGDVAPVAGIPLTGFSDPEFAIDAAGNVFISEINLANVAVSKSTDGGRSYGLQNVFAFTSTDRQWMAADGEDELYMTGNGFGGGPFPGEPAGNLGHFLAKSTDGGVTWGGASTTNPDGVGDIQIDQDRGVLYELSVTTAGTISMARFPNIRDETTDFTVEFFEIVDGVGLTGVQRLIDPTFDRDDDGNLYVTWSDNGTGARPQGIYYAYSTDDGETWSLPHRVDPDANADVWPWIAVGAPGQVVVAWLQGDQRIEGTLPGEDGGDDVAWNVAVATTSTGLGCGRNPAAGFTVTQASSEAIHTGTICQHGTVCQTDATDRRLGDYFSVETGPDGAIHVAVSDTRQGGAIALPLHIRQVAGPRLDAPAPPGPVVDPPASPAPAPEGPSLPATGGGSLIAALGLAVLAVGLAGRRRRRTERA